MHRNLPVAGALALAAVVSLASGASAQQLEHPGTNPSSTWVTSPPSIASRCSAVSKGSFTK